MGRVRITRPFVLLALAALMARPVEASRTSVWESNPHAALTAARTDAAGLLASPASADVVNVDAAELPAFDLGDVVLVESVLEHEDRLGLGPLDLLGPTPLRGPPSSYPETRVRGFELLPPFRVGASPRLSLWGRQACGFSCREVASDSRYDPWGLAVKVAPGTYDYREQGEAAKEDVRYLEWLASSPGSTLTDYAQRREFLTTAGKLAGHAAGWVFNRPEWDVLGMMSAVKVPSAIGRAGKALRAGEEALEVAARVERAGETRATRSGKAVHKALADDRRASEAWDSVARPIVDPAGKPVEVPRSVDLQTGVPRVEKGTQAAAPDAVSYELAVILDDKPLTREIVKDRQEIIRFIRAYESREGSLPKRVAIQRYDPTTGQAVRTDLFKPEDFLPRER